MVHTHKAVLANSFHRTSYKVHYTPGRPLSRSQMRRIRNTLCGYLDCHCGNDIGLRGPQTVDIGYKIHANGTITVYLSPIPSLGDEVQDA